MHYPLLFGLLTVLMVPTAHCWNKRIAHPVYEIPKNVLASLRSSMIDPGKYNWTAMDPEDRALPQLCGVPNPPSMRIVGGSEAAPNEFPWQVFLIVTFPNRPEVQCAGTLIYQDWVMTVAHCMEGASYIDVILGANNLMADEPNRVGLRSFNWIVHPDYDPNTLKGDIAVIRLPVAVPYNTYMRPICLPDIGTTQTFADDASTISGWGKSSDTARCISPVIRKTEVDVITNLECEKYYSPQYVREDTICSNTPGKSNCGGDSGGPLAFLRDDGTYVQIGITAFISAQGCEAGPNGYTRTSTYSQWISDECPLATTLAPTPSTTTTTPTPPTTAVTEPTTLCPPTYTTLSTKACPACPTNPVTTPLICTTTQQPQSKFSCINQPNGYYVDPNDACSGNFYLCVNGLTYLMNCPAGQAFNPMSYDCVTKTTIYPCNGAG